MKRSTLIGLSAVLVFLLGVAFLIHRADQPTKPAETAVTHLSAGDVTQIGLAVSGATITLKAVDGVWRVVAPFDDRAEVERVNGLIGAIRDVRIGSTLSENPAKFSQYDLTEATATRLQIYGRDHETPVFDLWVGKEAPNGLGCFVRAPGSNEVKIAEGLGSGALIKNPEEFRSTKVSPWEASDISSITVSGAVEVTLEKSSGSWVTSRNKRMVPADFAQQLGDAIRAWRADKFATTAAPEGFEKPYLTLEIDTPVAKLPITVGGVATEMPHARYVRVGDRSVVLIVQDSLTDAVVNALKKIQTL